MAKKIIKEGTVPKYIVKCPLCGTEFTFEHSDIESKTEMKTVLENNLNTISAAQYDPFTKIDFVTCPKCHIPINFNSSEIKRIYDVEK